jgi:hypothetical protein
MFTTVGRNFAFLAVVGGFAAMVGSFFFPFDIQSPDFRTSFNFRQASVLMFQGSVSVFFGLVLGVLCEISRKLDK